MTKERERGRRHRYLAQPDRRMARVQSQRYAASRVVEADGEAGGRGVGRGSRRSHHERRRRSGAGNGGGVLDPTLEIKAAFIFQGAPRNKFLAGNLAR